MGTLYYLFVLGIIATDWLGYPTRRQFAPVERVYGRRLSVGKFWLRYCLLFCLLFSGRLAHAEPINIKGAVIDVPAPPYYVRVTDELLSTSPEINRALRGLKEAHLGYYIHRNDVERLKSDANSVMAPSFILDAPPLPDSADISSDLFRTISKALETQNDQKREYASRLLPELREEYWTTGFPKETPLDKAISVLDEIPLRAHLSTDWVFSYSTYTNSDDNVGRASEEDREIIVGTVAYVRTSKRVLSILVLTPSHEGDRSNLEIGRKAIEEWAKLIVKGNGGTAGEEKR